MPAPRARILQRSSRACEPCRSLKTRCLPSNQNGVCSRCLSAKRECHWRTVQSRPKRGRPHTSRMSVMEQKLDGLVALIAGGGQSDPIIAQKANEPENAPSLPVSSTTITPTGTYPHSSTAPDQESITLTPHSLSDGENITVQAKRSTIPNGREPGSCPIQQNVGSGKRNDIHLFESTSTLPSGSNIGLNGAVTYHSDNGSLPVADDPDDEQLLSQYRSMTDYFPFVMIPDDVRASGLKLAKPMLFKAIMMTATWKNRGLQGLLEEDYKHELASRLFINVRKDVDLVQSILVYLGWYHFHFEPQSQQTFVLLSTLNGLIFELGLSAPKRRHPLMQKTGKTNSAESTPSTVEEQDEQRALLGCYHLSSTIPSAYCRPPLVRLSSYMTACSRRLAEEGKYPTDSTLQHMIQLDHIQDIIYDSFHLDENSNLTIDSVQTQMCLQSLQSRLKMWRDNAPSMLNAGLIFCHSFANFGLHGIGLRIPSTSANSHVSINTLLTCLDSAKQFLDLMLSTPLEDYGRFSFAEWSRLPYVIMMTARLTMPCESMASVGWDYRVARDSLRLDIYIETICYRLSSIAPTHSSLNGAPASDLFTSTKMILEMTRTWFSRKSNSSSIDQVSIPSVSFDALPQSQHQSQAVTGGSCPFSGSSRSGNTPPSRDSSSHPADTPTIHPSSIPQYSLPFSLLDPALPPLVALHVGYFSDSHASEEPKTQGLEEVTDLELWDADFYDSFLFTDFGGCLTSSRV